jgi:UDP-sulfoquinovose synthase
MACVELAVRNPASSGELRVYNQFTELFSVRELADQVASAAAALGIEAHVEHVDNPRVEAEEHYYNPRHSKLLDLGLRPHLLGPELIDSMLRKIQRYGDRITPHQLVLGVRWAPTTREHAPA